MIFICKMFSNIFILDVKIYASVFNLNLIISYNYNLTPTKIKTLIYILASNVVQNDTAIQIYG